MNIVFCAGVMPPELDWETREMYMGGWKYWFQFHTEKDHDIITQIPQFPHAHALLMKYDEWENIMDSQNITPDTTLVGHSAGGGFILKYMARHPELKVRQIVLVAPWIDPNNFQPFGFYKDLDLNNNIINQTKFGIDMLVSNDDMDNIRQSTDKIATHMSNIRVHKFENRGHFVSPELPELLDIIKY